MFEAAPRDRSRRLPQTARDTLGVASAPPQTPGGGGRARLAESAATSPAAPNLSASTIRLYQALMACETARLNRGTA